MKASELRSVLSKNINKDDSIFFFGKTKRSSVMILVVDDEDNLSLLFEVRSQFVKQPGEICFPGGRVEKDDGTTLVTAIRETQEELGIDKEKIELVGKLGDLVFASNHVISAYVGIVKKSDIDKGLMDKEEVEDLLIVPLEYLKTAVPDEMHYNVHARWDREVTDSLKKYRDNYHGTIIDKRRIISYDYKEHTIWGITARILEIFLKNTDVNYHK